MIYIPNYDPIIHPCAIVLDSNTIRVYNDMPLMDSSVSYTDYFYNSSYISKQGYQDITIDTELIQCIPNHTITTDLYYRNDIDGILITFMIYSFIMIYIPFKLLRIFFRK